VDEKKKKRQKKPKQLKWEMHGRKVNTKARGVNADAILEDEVAANSFSFDGANALLPAEPFPQAGRISGPNVVRVYFFNIDGMNEKGALYEEIRPLRPDVVFLFGHRGSRARDLESEVRCTTLASFSDPANRQKPKPASHQPPGRAQPAPGFNVAKNLASISDLNTRVKSARCRFDRAQFYCRRAVSIRCRPMQIIWRQRSRDRRSRGPRDVSSFSECVSSTSHIHDATDAISW
jgi:hypothetical protein